MIDNQIKSICLLVETRFQLQSFSIQLIFHLFCWIRHFWLPIFDCNFIAIKTCAQPSYSNGSAAEAGRPIKIEILFSVCRYEFALQRLHNIGPNCTQCTILLNSVPLKMCHHHKSNSLAAAAAGCPGNNCAINPELCANSTLWLDAAMLRLFRIMGPPWMHNLTAAAAVAIKIFNQNRWGRDGSINSHKHCLKFIIF